MLDGWPHTFSGDGCNSKGEATAFNRTWKKAEFQFHISFVPPPEELVLTKGNVLKKTAPIHDPFVVRAKMLMQEAWMKAIGWDEELPNHLKVQWKDGSKSLENLCHLRSMVPQGREGGSRGYFLRLTTCLRKPMPQHRMYAKSMKMGR